MLTSGDDCSERESELVDVHESDSKSNSVANSLTETDDYQRLSEGLLKWAERHETHGFVQHERKLSSSSNSTNISPDVSIHDFCNAGTLQDDQLAAEKGTNSGMMNEENMPPKVHFANKVLGRLYNRRAVASGLVFSRGHFLGDIEKMVQGLLASVSDADSGPGDVDSEQYLADDNDDAVSWETMTIHEEGGEHTAHTSTLAAGKDGCVVLILPKASLIPFLDAHPGVLLSLLGTQVVV